MTDEEYDRDEALMEWFRDHCIPTPADDEFWRDVLLHTPQPEEEEEPWPVTAS
jgi:hypothetical protein